MDRPIRKAVLPVAGLGTRFLPATKAIPKEMLTVVDRPILQHVVDEAREAGIEHFVFVTGRNKAVIEDHFDAAYELEDTLIRRGKKAEYSALMADLPAAGATSFTRQQAPLGLGHAVWCAREIVGDEPFAVLLPDMVTRAGSHGGRCLAQCVAAYEKHGGNIIAVEEVPPAETHQYGIVGGRRGPWRDLRDHREWSKSRSREQRRPTSSFRGATFFSRRSSRFSSGCEKGAGGEIQLTDGMIELARKQSFHGARFDGRTYDCGSKLGFLSANLAFALDRGDIAPGLKEELRRLGFTAKGG